MIKACPLEMEARVVKSFVAEISAANSMKILVLRGKKISCASHA